MRIGLAPRLLAASLVVLLFVSVVFALVLHEFRTVRAATDRQQRAAQAVVAAERTEKLVLDLETSTRGFVITGDEAFLQPWHAARRQLPVELADLPALVPGDESTAIVRTVRDYEDGYSVPLVVLARRDRDRAGMRLQMLGKRRVDAIRGLIDPFVAELEARVVRDRAAVRRQEHEGTLIGIAGIVVAALVFVLGGAYFTRAAVAPLRRMVAATGEVAAGRAVSVPEHAPGEIGQLAAAFNEMSRSLAQSQHSREEQNVDLERLANLLRAVLDATVDGILLSDRDGAVQLANRPMVAIGEELGMSLGQNVLDNLLSIEGRMTDPQRFRETIERLRANPDEASVNEFEVADTARVFLGFVSPVHDLHGGFVGRIWTLREVTRERELDRLKDEFVATVSHELRTPLTSLMGFVEMLRAGDAGALTADQQRFLSIVHRSSERLQRLVGDLLFVARLDSGGLRLAADQVRVDEVLVEVAETTLPLAGSHELELHVEAAPVPPIVGDRERLAQVISNLLSNAVKFTPPGGRVDARTFVHDGRVVIEVEDTGIGVPPIDQGRLFDRFFRSSNATEQAVPGTGLGLAITKAIAEAHEGRVTLRSQVDVGTCFRVELPLERERTPV
jgi:signal transduction histidine kinase/CHASE3 domain sensor protein